MDFEKELREIQAHIAPAGFKAEFVNVMRLATVEDVKNLIYPVGTSHFQLYGRIAGTYVAISLEESSSWSYGSSAINRADLNVQVNQTAQTCERLQWYDQKIVLVRRLESLRHKLKYGEPKGSKSPE